MILKTYNLSMYRQLRHLFQEQSLNSKRLKRSEKRREGHSRAVLTERKLLKINFFYCDKCSDPAELLVDPR